MRRRLLSFLVGMLLVPLLLTSAGPALARAIAGAAPHVCRCDAQHTDCDCTICHPHRGRDESSPRPAAKGICGDQEVVFAAWHVAGVLPGSVSSLAPAPVGYVVPLSLGVLRDRAPPPPEPPPPRA